jgi:hypothetical protein
MSTGSATPQTISDLYVQVGSDDATVTADQQKLAADQSTDTSDVGTFVTKLQATKGFVHSKNDGTFDVVLPDATNARGFSVLNLPDGGSIPLS